MAQHRLPLTDHRAVSAAIRLFAPSSSPSPDSPRSASAASAAAAATPEEVIALVAALRRVGGRLDVVHYTTAINHAGTREGGVGKAKAGAGGRGGREGGRRDGVEEGALEAAQKGAERARALLAWMAEDGVKPNDVTYTSLIHIFGQVRFCSPRVDCVVVVVQSAPGVRNNNPPTQRPSPPTPPPQKNLLKNNHPTDLPHHTHFRPATSTPRGGSSRRACRRTGSPPRASPSAPSSTPIAGAGKWTRR